MLFRTTVLLIAFAVALPATAEYRTAPELVDAMLDAERKRAEGVSNYALDITVMGQPSTQYFERGQIDVADGGSLAIFRLVPLNEVQQRLQGDAGVSAADLKSYAGAAGFPSGMLQQADEIDPAAMLARAEIVGREAIDGRNAYLVKADDLNLTQRSDGSEFLIRSITLWVDTDDLVMRKMRMDGVVKQDGQAREMFLEKLDQDYRAVPGSSMILPFKSVIRMDGMLDPKQQKEMEQARQQLAELDRQMASMPADQKDMMQSMMGPKIEMMRKMVEGGAFEIETIVRAVRVNPGISGAFAAAPTAAPGGLAAVLGQLPAMIPPEPERDDEPLRQAREACLEQKVAEAKAAKKKKKRFGKFLGAAGRIAGRHAGSGLAGDISRVSGDIYAVQATSRDAKDAAEALGITQDDIEACENPE